MEREGASACCGACLRHQLDSARKEREIGQAAPIDAAEVRRLLAVAVAVVITTVSADADAGGVVKVIPNRPGRVALPAQHRVKCRLHRRLAVVLRNVGCLVRRRARRAARGPAQAQLRHARRVRRVRAVFARRRRARIVDAPVGVHARERAHAVHARRIGRAVELEALAAAQQAVQVVVPVVVQPAGRARLRRGCAEPHVHVRRHERTRERRPQRQVVQQTVQRRRHDLLRTAEPEDAAWCTSHKGRRASRSARDAARRFVGRTRRPCASNRVASVVRYTSCVHTRAANAADPAAARSTMARASGAHLVASRKAVQERGKRHRLVSTRAEAVTCAAAHLGRRDPPAASATSTTRLRCGAAAGAVHAFARLDSHVAIASRTPEVVVSPGARLPPFGRERCDSGDKPGL